MPKFTETHNKKTQIDVLRLSAQLAFVKTIRPAPAISASRVARNL